MSRTSQDDRARRPEDDERTESPPRRPESIDRAHAARVFDRWHGDVDGQALRDELSDWFLAVRTRGSLEDELFVVKRQFRAALRAFGPEKPGGFSTRLARSRAAFQSVRARFNQRLAKAQRFRKAFERVAEQALRARAVEAVVAYIEGESLASVSRRVRTSKWAVELDVLRVNRQLEQDAEVLALLAEAP